MTDQQRLSIFEWDGPTFPEVRRAGYDKDAVHAFLHSHAGDAEQVRAEAAAITDACQALRAEVVRLTANLSEAGVPTVSGMAGRVGEVLVEADEKSKQILTEAERQAEQVRRQAEADATETRSQATKEIEQARVDRLTEAEADSERAVTEAENERSQATKDREQMLATVGRDAEQRRRVAREEADSIRSAAVRYAEQTRAEADKEVAEERRESAAAGERQQQQAETRNAAACDRAATLADEPQARLADVEKRTKDAVAQTKSHRDASRREAERMVARARRHAEQLLADARSTSAMNATAQATGMTQRTAKLAAEVDKLQRREAVMRARIAELKEMAADLRDVEDDADVDSIEPK